MKKRFICLCLIFALAGTQTLTAFAARKDEIQAEKTLTQSQLSQAESKASELEKKKNALLGEIDALDQSLVQVMAQIDILNGEISDKENAIEETKVQLAEAEADRDEQYESMKKRIQYLYEKGGTNAWGQMLLESGDLTTMLSKAESTEKMYEYDRDQLKKMKEVVKQVTDLGNQLTQEKAELVDMKQVQEEQQETLKVTLEAKKSTASDYESQIASAQAQANEYRKLIEQQNAELRKIQEEEERAAEEARKAQEKAEQEAAQKRAQAQASSGNTSGTQSSSQSSGGSSGSSNTESQNTGNSGSSGNGSTGGSSTGGSSTGNSSSGSGSAGSSNTGSSSSSSATGEAVVAYASQFIGNPYVYGGNSLTNGIDCSAFVQQIFGHFGYSLPRVTDAQASAGRGISYSESRAGDIIVYSGHVGILTGDGGIVHASNSAPYPQGGIKYSSNALYRPYIAVRRIVE